ncbi:MAG TPA: C1 family peptidase [Chitinophagaceae bacterium]
MAVLEKVKQEKKIALIEGNGHREIPVQARIEATERLGLGWIPDHPDFRDYTFKTEEIKEAVNEGVAQLKSKRSKFSPKTRSSSAEISLFAPPTAPPPSVDLRPWCSPIENQGSLGSCTANAGVGLLEYFERRAFNNHIDASRLFLYKTTRNLMQLSGDTGAYLRTTMAAMVLFGVPPEKYWPYNISGFNVSAGTSNFDVEPPSFCYSFAANYKSIKYFRLDPPGTTMPTLLNNIKSNLVNFLPCMFGFSVYNSIGQAQATGKIPLPATSGDPFIGGHAVVAVGYNDTIKIQNSIPGSPLTTGALLIRNSWGAGWGPMGGYLWMPYDYILKGLASDFWTLISAEYVATGNFGI